VALIKKGKFWYGETQKDIQEELGRYGQKNYPIQHFAEAVCRCGSHAFRLLLDDNVGAAVRTCVACGAEHPIGDSEVYLADAQLEECECPCGQSTFEITVGVALYEGSDDVRWIYIGCRCPGCGLTACYGDWKNEFEDYRILLSRV
jgi:hypothetical protein